MKFLTKFSDLQKCQENDEVFFYGKVINISYTTKSIAVRFYDGNNLETFYVFNDDFELTLNKLYKFTGRVTGFEKLWFKVSWIEEVALTKELEQKFYPEKFYRITPELQYVYLNSYSLIQNELYKKILAECLGLGTNDALSNSVFKSPASINYHDNYRGGLVNHIASMLNICRVLQTEYSITRKKYKEIDWDLLYTLVYLHDIGKPDTYNEINDGFKWNDSITLNHSILGVCKVYNACVKLGIDIKNKCIQVLLKGIEQHMGSDKPVCPEVQLLKAIDSIDAILAITV